MKASMEMLIVCGTLLGGVAALVIILTLFAPCIKMRNSIHKTISILVFLVLGVTVTSSALNFYRLFPLPLFIYMNFTIFVYWGSFVAPATRHIVFRLLISWPTAIYQASCLLMLPFTWVTWVFTPWFAVAVLGLGVIGFLQSSLLLKEYVYFSLYDTSDTDALQSIKPKRARVTRKRKPISALADGFAGKRSLKIAQITDPHLGTFMSKDRLHEICRTIVNWNPDLVFLTGDFTTIESYFEADKLAYGFSPLKEMQGKLFACLGNHDYESLDTVETALRETGVTLLKDEHALVETRIGTVEIVGTEFTFARGAAVRDHITRVCQQFPKLEHPRICLVHNPEEFTHFPDGTADLVFSGHTHGGQIGLFSLGLNATMYGLFTRRPDHGLWRQGSNTLYVHRGTGFYGFPLRLGVSGELSLLNVAL